MEVEGRKTTCLSDRREEVWWSADRGLNKAHK